MYKINILLWGYCCILGGAIYTHGDHSNDINECNHKCLHEYEYCVHECEKDCKVSNDPYCIDKCIMECIREHRNCTESCKEKHKR